MATEIVSSKALKNCFFSIGLCAHPSFSPTHFNNSNARVHLLCNLEKTAVGGSHGRYQNTLNSQLRLNNRPYRSNTARSTKPVHRKSARNEDRCCVHSLCVCVVCDTVCVCVCACVCVRSECRRSNSSTDVPELRHHMVTTGGIFLRWFPIFQMFRETPKEKMKTADV
jgi:hypothetical protein